MRSGGQRGKNTTVVFAQSVGLETTGIRFWLQEI